MRSSRSGSIAVALAACLAGCGGGVGVGGSSPTGRGSRQPHVPLKDSFAGHVSGATDRLVGEQGSLTVELQPGTGGASVRQVTVTLTGLSCGVKRRCLLLAGALQGMIAAEAGLADVGRTLSIRASGVIRPLGRVSAVGTVTGVGNARFGHESLRLTLNSSTGSVLVNADSAELPAFTSP